MISLRIPMKAKNFITNLATVGLSLTMRHLISRKLMMILLLLLLLLLMPT
jgi:hypothetical protein